MFSFKKFKKYRQTVEELERMSDRELHDIGISRIDIRKIAKQHVGI